MAWPAAGTFLTPVKMETTMALLVQAMNRVYLNGRQDLRFTTCIIFKNILEIR